MKKTNESQSRHDQIQAIKKRLTSALDKSGWSTYQLTNEINNQPDSLGANYNTVKNTLDFSSDALDMITVLIHRLDIEISFTTHLPGEIQNVGVKCSFTTTYSVYLFLSIKNRPPTKRLTT